MILAKDFIETVEGLVFAVVESGLEEDKVLCFLRYIKQGSAWKKVNTEQANQYLSKKYPHYLYYSPVKQAHCHALTLAQVHKHHQPQKRVKQLLESGSDDIVEKDCIALCLLFQQHDLDLALLGVTGSILISAQKTTSDIDLVFYSRDVFNQARAITKKLIEQGKCSQLSQKDWLESYDRRQGDLSYKEYVWHEKRKFNKAMINQRKFDLSLVNVDNTEQSIDLIEYKKLEAIVLKVQVVDDSFTFDYPAKFIIDHSEIKSIVCYTATYTGQAKAGEWIEVSGVVEQATEGDKRIVVGSSREACGEYIKVINA